jgi:hypothetical protein
MAPHRLEPVHRHDKSKREGEIPFDPTRRTILAGAGIAALSSLLDACIVRPIPFPAKCAIKAPASASAAGEMIAPLTIDAHCHIFNGTDLQVKKFLIEVVEKGQDSEAIKIAADLLQDANWDLAPDGKDELRVLKQLAACENGPMFEAKVEDHRQAGYARARKAILQAQAMAAHAKAKQAAKAGGPNSPAPPSPPPPLQPHAIQPSANPSKQEVAEQIYQRLPEDYADYKKMPPPPPVPRAAGAAGPRVSSLGSSCAGPSGRSLDGMVDYVVENFQYRYVMIQDYLSSMKSPGRSVDLMLASMVDYDWWLNGGAPTKTHLDMQVLVMEQISILTRGQVHGFAPFDPLREVAFRAGKHSRNFSSLGLVQRAVGEHGSIGVKLYPPMGFAALGNADQSRDFWNDSDIPGWLKKPFPYNGKMAEIGPCLDDALEGLYAWCVDQDVPIMAHTAFSNGVATKYQELAGATYWAKALNKYPGLRISFGHLGDFSDTLGQETSPDAAKLVDLMSDLPGTAGARAYADTGYFSEVISEQNCLAERLKEFYTRPVSSGKASLAGRLMYGTDWNLLMNQGDVDSYVPRFIAVFEQLDKEIPPTGGLTLSERFFGRNAIDWLGVNSGKARVRLENFYKKYDIPEPKWFAGV